jgi:hypothetical protein
MSECKKCGSSHFPLVPDGEIELVKSILQDIGLKNPDCMIAQFIGDAIWKKYIKIKQWQETDHYKNLDSESRFVIAMNIERLDLDYKK